MISWIPNDFSSLEGRFNRSNFYICCGDIEVFKNFSTSAFWTCTKRFITRAEGSHKMQPVCFIVFFGGDERLSNLRSMVLTVLYRQNGRCLPGLFVRIKNRLQAVESPSHLHRLLLTTIVWNVCCCTSHWTWVLLFTWRVRNCLSLRLCECKYCILICLMFTFESPIQTTLFRIHLGISNNMCLIIDRVRSGRTGKYIPVRPDLTQKERGKGWLINEACRKARAWTKQPMIFDILFEWTNANAQQQKSFNHILVPRAFGGRGREKALRTRMIQPLHYCVKAVKLTTRLWMKLNEQTISFSQNVSSKRTSLLKVSPHLRPRTQWYQMITRRFFPLESSFDSEGALVPGRTRFWIFMTPIWAPENKARVCISLVEGASAPDDFGDFVVFTAAPLRIFDSSRCWAWDTTA